jgi:hypothetical protein
MIESVNWSLESLVSVTPADGTTEKVHTPEHPRCVMSETAVDVVWLNV